jgi:hypothetical protein
MQRNFNCPETGEKCISPHCTTECCIETVNIAAKANAPREKVYDRGFYEVVRHMVEKIKVKRK